MAAPASATTFPDVTTAASAVLLALFLLAALVLLGGLPTATVGAVVIAALALVVLFLATCIDLKARR